MLTLRAMQIFLRVVREGSFSAAGRQLGLSAGATARSVTSLEESLGVRLIARSSRKLSLTSAGHSFHDRIAPLIEEIQHVADSISRAEEEARGPLRVHCRITLGTRILTPALPRFYQAYPDIQLTLLMSNDTAIDMVGDNIDVDLQVGPREDSSLRARQLAPGGSLLCAAPAYLAASPALEKPQDLLDHYCLTYQFGSAAPVWAFHARDGTVTDLPIDAKLRTDNGVALQACVEHGLGLGLLPHWSIGDSVAEGRLVHCLPDYQVRHSGLGNAVYAVYHESRARSQRVRVFVDFLAGLFAQARARGPAGSWSD